MTASRRDPFSDPGKLAISAGINRTYVSQLESGHKSPTVDVLIRICDSLGIRASELLARMERGAKGES